MKNIIIIICVIFLLVWAAPAILMALVFAASAVSSVFDSTPGWSFAIVGIIILLAIFLRKK